MALLFTHAYEPSKMAANICGHCNKQLGSKAYKQHKRDFFHEGQWINTCSSQRNSRESSPLVSMHSESRSVGLVGGLEDNSSSEMFVTVPDPVDSDDHDANYNTGKII